jgi:hypothetical protein
MKFVSSLAIAASLIVGAAGASAASAQQAQQAPAQPRKYNFSKEAQKALGELQAATSGKTADWAEKFAAAQAVAKNSDDKYVLAKFQLQHAIDTNDQAAQLAAVDALLASGGADAAETAQLYAVIAGTASKNKDYARAEGAYAALAAANPNDPQAVVNLASVKIELKKDAEALALLQKAIGMSKSAGQKAPESWYRNALGLAHKLNNASLAAQLAQETQQAYPTQNNFKNLIALSQADLAKDEQAYIDLMRLMQVSGNLQSGTDYLRLAQQFEFERNWGEAKSVLEAAARAGKSSPAHTALLNKVSAQIAEDKAALPGAEPKARNAPNGGLALNLATVYAGYGDYAKAVDLYRVALQKGGVDANLVNTRLGIALAAAGQRAEAETAFRAVTGTRAPLANLWLNWLGQQR